MVITGVSGSGKSSLAFDTIYAEGPAPLRRVAVGLRPPVPRADGEARRRSHRGHRPVDRHPPEEQRPQPALHGRHGHRDPRLHAAAVRPRRPHLLPAVRRRGDPRDGRGGVRPAAGAVAGRAAAHRLRHAGAGGRAGGRPATRRRGRRGRAARRRRRRAAAVQGGAVAGGGGRRRAAPQGLRPAAGRRRGHARFEDLDAGRLRGPAVAGGGRRPAARSSPRSRTRITDAVEIAYQEGGGAAWVVQLGERRRARRPPRLQRAVRVPHLRPVLRGPAAAAVLVQQPVRRLSDLPRLRQHHRARPRPGRPRRGQDAAAGRDRAVDQAALPLLRSPISKKMAKARGVPLDVPWQDLTDEQRRLVVEGDGDFEGVRGFFDWLERKKYKVHVRVFLSRYRGYQTCPDCAGHAAAARGAGGAGRRPDHRPGLGAHHPPGAGLLRRARPAAAGRGDRRQGAQGDPPPARLPERRRPRVPDPRPAVVDAVGRRGAAHQPGDVARRVAGRHALRARRAVDRPAPARQPAAHRHPAAAARSGQHRDRRRARRRHDRGGRSTSSTWASAPASTAAG